MNEFIETHFKDQKEHCEKIILKEVHTWADTLIKKYPRFTDMETSIKKANEAYNKMHSSVKP